MKNKFMDYFFSMFGIFITIWFSVGLYRAIGHEAKLDIVICLVGVIVGVACCGINTLNIISTIVFNIRRNRDAKRIVEELQREAPSCVVCGTKYEFIGWGMYEGRCACKEETGIEKNKE